MCYVRLSLLDVAPCHPSSKKNRRRDRNGRDHNPYGFTMWMAGGGVKKGFSYGKTDELGYKPIENPVSMHDFHATILDLMGLKHDLLTFRFNGREQSLVNGLGSVVKDIIA